MKNDIKKQAKEAFYDGRIIEAGWLSTWMANAPKEASQEQLVHMREIFFSGVCYLRAILLNPPGRTPEEVEEIMRVMVKNIEYELREFLDAREKRSENLH